MQSNYPFDVSLLKSSNVPMATVQKGDVVRIADSDLDFLQEFYNTRYDGNPIKPFASRFAIAIKNDMNGTEYKNDLILLYVRSLDNGTFIQVDMYQKSVGDRILWTEVLDNSKKMVVVDGHFFMESYSIHREGGLFEYARGNEKQITTYISDVVHYVLFFMQENPHKIEDVENLHFLFNLQIEDFGLINKLCWFIMYYLIFAILYFKYQLSIIQALLTTLVPTLLFLVFCYMIKSFGSNQWHVQNI